MPKTLPQDWLDGTRNTLNVRDDLGLKRLGVPANLRIKRNKGKTTQNLFAEYLPAEEDDTRAHAGRSKGGRGKRITVSASMGTPDAFEAGKRAIEWVLQKQKEAKAIREQAEEQQQHALSVYWERWFARESISRQSKRNYVRWRRDERLKWDGDGYGIKHQPWAQKSVEQINALDFEDYWRVLDSRRTTSNDMGGTKGQQKTLIIKLLKEARRDFPKLVIPDFPEIQRQTKQVVHLKHDEWERLIAKVVELSGGAAIEPLSPSQYKGLQFSKANQKNIRNWVDLYDALHLMWFFYLRAEDIPRLRAEWFQDVGDEIVCNLEITKGDRTKHRTTHYRDDALGNWRRLKVRKPKGYLAFPHLVREDENPTETSVLKNFNRLLRFALDECVPPITSKGITATNIRHTAIRLTLEDIPSLSVPGAPLNSFAENARTSTEMLYKTYLRYIESEKTAREARKQSKPGKYSMVKRVSLD